MISSSRFVQQMRMFSLVLNDKERKALPILLSDVARMSLKYRCLPNHYVSRYLYKKNCTNILDYLPNTFLYSIKSKFNDLEVAEVLENKLYFNLFYGQFGLSLPRIMCYNHKKIFVSHGESIEINNPLDFKLFLLELMTSTDLHTGFFVKRTYGTYGGDRIHKILKKDLTDDDDLVYKLYHEVTSSGYLFQETIRQHPLLDVLNPSCINTIRFDSFIDNTGKIELISAHIRMSMNNMHIDNMGSGGCAVSVDLNSGCLKKLGYSVFKRSGGRLLTEHPITKTVFENFAIPHFDEAKNLVLKAASLMPALRLIGWDVGISTLGPVLIEGNSDYDITGSDLMYGGYLANPVFRKALKEIKFIK